MLICDHWFHVVFIRQLSDREIPLLYFYKDGFGIKLFMKVDVPLNKETKPNKTR